MSAAGYTPGPWHQDGVCVVTRLDCGKEYVAECAEFRDETNKENAARIVACVNACAGMDDPVDDVRWLRHKATRYDSIVFSMQAPTDGGLQALNICVRKTLFDWYGTGGGHRLAQLLGSLYNGDRVKANLWRALGGGIDTDVFEHVLTVFRLHATGGHEIHTYFDPGQPLHDPKLGGGGNAIFERIIKDYGLEKRRRSRS